MIESLIYLLVLLIVLACVWYIVSTLLPLPEPIGRIVQVVLVVIAVIAIIYLLLGFTSGGLRVPR